MVAGTYLMLCSKVHSGGAIGRDISSLYLLLHTYLNERSPTPSS